MINPATTYVVGHRNPDVDAVCAAIAYAAFKQERGEGGYVAACCGHSNARIDAVLARFHTPLPLHLGSVAPLVRDCMTLNPHAVTPGSTCAEALHLFDQHGIALLPVIATGHRAIGTITLTQLGHFFIPRPGRPREMGRVRSSLTRIARSLGASMPQLIEGDRLEDLFVRVGVMELGTFWKISERDNIPAGGSIVILGDRRDLQQRAIELGVRALIISGGVQVDPGIAKFARGQGVSILTCAHDTATTAWLVRTASTLEPLVDRDFVALRPDVLLADVRREFARSAAHAMVVTDEAGALQGILTKTDLLKPVSHRLVLVDHNELSQAVPGAAEATITEIIDHHRLGPVTSSQPILFINEPVGSTCTIVADLFRREGLRPRPNLAGLMAAGLIADTLSLQGPTSTPKDAEVLTWLEAQGGFDARELGELIFQSGSIILSSPPDKAVRADVKVYEESGVKFAVSQIEEIGFAHFWAHAKAMTAAVAELRAEEELVFACLLVTDLSTKNSLLVIQGDDGIICRIGYAPVVRDEIFDLPGVVSRKKQLLPYLTNLLRESDAAGARTSSRPALMTPGPARLRGLACPDPGPRQRGFVPPVRV